MKNLYIPGYTIEVEKNRTKMRVATYISNKIKYKRRQDLEEPDSHIIILDIGVRNKLRVFNLYSLHSRTLTFFTTFCCSLMLNEHRVCMII